MPQTCLPWDSRQRQVLTRRCRQADRKALLLPGKAGPAAAELRATPESSARNAVSPDLLRMRSGPAPAERKIRGNSVWSAEDPSRPVCRSTNVTNAAGSQRIRSIRRNSVRSAEIRLMMEISSDSIIRKRANGRKSLGLYCPGFGMESEP